MKKDARVISNLKNTQRFAAIGAALGSMAPVFAAAYSACYNWTGIAWISFLVGCAAVLLSLAVIEYGMFSYLPFGLRGVLSGEAWNNWRTTALYIAILALSFGYMTSSGYLSFEGRKDVGNLVAGKVETKDATKIAASLSNIENERLREVKKEIIGIENKISKREKKIKQSNRNLTELAENGNGWALSQIDKKIEKDPDIKRLKQQLGSASETKSSILKQSNVSETVSAINLENISKLETRQERFETSKGIVGAFGIVSIIIFFLSTTIIELYNIETETKPVKTPTPPNEVIPIKSSGPEVDRKAETALRQSLKNRDDIEKLKQVSETVSSPVSIEISETKAISETPKRKQKTETETSSNPVSETWKPKKSEIVSKGNSKAIWVPGFKSEPFSLSQCNSKLRQYEWKLKDKKKGSKGEATCLKNIQNFKKAIEILS